MTNTATERELAHQQYLEYKREFVTKTEQLIPSELHELRQLNQGDERIFFTRQELIEECMTGQLFELLEEYDFFTRLLSDDRFVVDVVPRMTDGEAKEWRRANANKEEIAASHPCLCADCKAKRSIDA